MATAVRDQVIEGKSKKKTVLLSDFPDAQSGPVWPYNYAVQITFSTRKGNERIRDRMVDRRFPLASKKITALMRRNSLIYTVPII